MDGGLLHLHSKSVLKPQLNLFTIPPTELSMSSYCIVSIQPYSPRGDIKNKSSNSPIQTYMTSINPVEFQVDPQEDYVDLSQSFFEIELALKLANGDNVVKATRLWFKTISLRLNGTLMSPQTHTYHYKAYLETLLNYNRNNA